MKRALKAKKRVVVVVMKPRRARAIYTPEGVLLGALTEAALDKVLVLTPMHRRQPHVTIVPAAPPRRKGGRK